MVQWLRTPLSLVTPRWIFINMPVHQFLKPTKEPWNRRTLGFLCPMYGLYRTLADLGPSKRILQPSSEIQTELPLYHVQNFVCCYEHLWHCCHWCFGSYKAGMTTDSIFAINWLFNFPGNLPYPKQQTISLTPSEPSIKTILLWPHLASGPVWFMPKRSKREHKQYWLTLQTYQNVI